MTKSIEIKNLFFEYDENLNTIDDVSFDVENGSYTVILGHNGSGKSTIAKLIIGLLEAKSGKIVVDGIELNDENVYKVRERVGIVFQNPDNQFIGATVRDDIAFGLENRCVPQTEMDGIINKYAKKVDMIDFLDHEPTKLSGGQKQRVAIAGILAMSPDIIILDEATSMLDPKGRREINALVKELNEETNMTVISISHDIEEAVNADRVVVLNNGKVVKDGTPEDILTDEALMYSLELDVPFAYKVSKKLAENGIEVGKNLKEKELIEKLCLLNLNK
ncbi:energy-coupling factor transporter ATPase [Beduini massiliensis]|uniref:energy-coupling factor transporter ATPase n=1 Tax=Beduini massiliensis TaxID=1585974 RepID=UPI00059A84F7|nr:energy-coupling factor transporter ATPase [Beduini massiliensis]